jgi:glycopeptide antibiotics resistance protein
MGTVRANMRENRPDLLRGNLDCTTRLRNFRRHINPDITLLFCYHRVRNIPAAVVLNWHPNPSIPFSISTLLPISSWLPNSMTQNNPDPPSSRTWTNRILAASLFGILFFTLFPYWVDFAHKHSPGRSLFLLSRPLGFDGFLHTSLNVLLFMPLGFALSQFFPVPKSGRKKSLLLSAVLALIVGATLSYSIEIIQLYMPSRDSAWDDVIANTLGSLLGTFVGLGIGRFIFQKLSQWESRAEQFLSIRKISFIALIYFGAWLAISVPLQQKTHLNNWDPNSFLFVGYDAREDTRWSGSVSLVQLWDHALTDDRATAISGNASVNVVQDSNLLASYNLSQPPPIVNNIRQLPNLVLASTTQLPTIAHHARRTEGPPVLMSAAPTTALSSAVRESNQFAVLVRCVPSRDDDLVDDAIFAIATPSGKFNFDLRQEHSNAVIYIRTGLESSRRAALAWHVPKIFAANVSRSILFSYDGAQGFLYVDGEKISKSFYLSPGAAGVGDLTRIKTDELVAYSGLYESLVFLPLGFLLGLAVRKVSRRDSIYKLGVAVSLVLPAVLLETLLVELSGRRPSISAHACYQ